MPTLLISVGFFLLPG